MTDLSQTISLELSRAGFRPDPDYFSYICARTQHFGELEYDLLRNEIGPELGRRRRLAVRLLGFGHVMTEFVVAHRAFAERPDPAVLSLGSLANLIVSSYDGLLDSGQDPEEIPLRSRLTDSGIGQGSGDSLIARLVDLYLARLSLLPHPHRQIHEILRRAILRMYDAERATVGEFEFSETNWRRKCALPFVIMGLPVWMTVPVPDAVVVRAHLAWLYRLGRFFGWIDDVSDLSEDLEAGRPNFFVSRRTLSGRRIARQGDLVLATWDEGARPDRYSRTLRQTFFSVTWSWLGMNTSSSDP